MRVNFEHLRSRRRLTLYVPERFIPYVEMAAELADCLLYTSPKEEGSKAGKLSGVLAAYAGELRPDFKAIREKVKEEVARNAAEEGVADRR